MRKKQLETAQEKNNEVSVAGITRGLTETVATGDNIFWVKPFMAPHGATQWENTISVLPVIGWLRVEIQAFEAPVLEVPEFTTPCCRGSIKLGTACGSCERCKWYQSNGTTY